MYGYGYYHKKELKLDTLPYDDDKLLWDEEERMYVLNPKYVTKKAFNTSEEWGSDEATLLELTRIARNFKDFITNESCKYNDLDKDKSVILEYKYAKDHKMREDYAQGMLRFAILDSKTDGGTDAEYFGDKNITQNNIYMFLINKLLINKASLCYTVEVVDGDFDKGVDPNGA